MGSLGSIGRLIRGVGKQFANPRKIEARQQGSVKKDGVAGSALGVSGEFTFAGRIDQGQVGMAANHHPVLQTGTEALRLAVHDPLIRAGDRP